MPDAGDGTMRGQQIAGWLAAVALFIAPFRSSAGLRAALILLAAIVLIFATRAGWQALLAAPRALRVVAALWVGLVALWAGAGDTPVASLGAMRGAILTPLLTFAVFFAVSDSLKVVGRVILALTLGVLILTVMVILEPFQPHNIAHTPRYGSVGTLSTWLITLAPLLPLLWVSAKPSRWWRLVAFVFVVALLVAAWLTANRAIWLCYAAMLLVGSAFAWSDANRAARRVAMCCAGAAIVLIGVFAAAAQMRATLHHAPNNDAVEFLRHDSRAEIWHIAGGMIAERPLTGYGYGDRTLGDKFSARFADPAHRKVFRHAHNVVLNRALEMGVTGALLVLGVFASLAYAFWQLARKQGLARLSGICGIALVCGFLLRNMVDDFFSQHCLLLFMALAGLFLRLGTAAAEQSSRTKLQAV